MFNIDNKECDGCGNCVAICSQQAISIINSLAVIDQKLCIHCGACSEICPAGAIKEIVTAYTFLRKGGDTMTYVYGGGFGRGIGHRGGVGFAFRGNSPSRPYYGRGRGGLPRCWYPGVPMTAPYETPAPFYPSRINREDELDWLKAQAEAIKAELGRIEARMSHLETSE